MKQRSGRFAIAGLLLIPAIGLLLISNPAYALEANEYRQFLGLDSRKLVWFLAQMHLFFGASC